MNTLTKIEELLESSYPAKNEGISQEHVEAANKFFDSACGTKINWKNTKVIDRTSFVGVGNFKKDGEVSAFINYRIVYNTNTKWLTVSFARIGIEVGSRLSKMLGPIQWAEFSSKTLTDLRHAMLFDKQH